MKKTEIQKYHSLILTNVQTAFYLVTNNLIRDKEEYKNIRIGHYKLSTLLDVISAIKDKTAIILNSQSIFFDFPFIEMTLRELPLEEQFKLFEIMLNKYIEEFENISFENYKIFYAAFLCADKLPEINDEKSSCKTTAAILDGIAQNESNIRKKIKSCEMQCSVLKQFLKMDSNQYNQKEVEEYILSLGISEPFVHYFIRYIEKKKEKNVFIPKKFINYTFENPEFINLTTEKNDVQTEKRLLEIFDQSYNSAEEKMNNNKMLYVTFYKNLFNTLKRNFGQQFVGFYEIVFFELRYIKANDNELYNVLIRVILNDIQFLITHPTYKCRKEEYTELKNALKNNFTLQSFNEKLEEDKIRESLIKISFPEKFIDQFILLMKKDYCTLFSKKKKPYENTTKIAVKKKKLPNSNPTLTIEEPKKKKTIPIETILNNEEQLIYQQVLEIIEENNSLIEGYVNDLKISIETINEAAELIAQTPEDKNLLHECIKDEMQTINGILENIYLLNQYKNTLKPQKEF